MSDVTSRFFQHLTEACAKNGAAKATLRRSLSFPPGEWPRAYPYVESFVSGAGTNEWLRRAFYLAAGLWAAGKAEDDEKMPQGDKKMPLGKAASRYRKKTDSGSVEKRFIALLDADTDQLPHRLRQMCAMLKDYLLEYPALLDGLLSWNAPGRGTQKNWARDFYSGSGDAAGKPKGEETL